MNGISLMIAVAAIGLDVAWETGPGGQEYYTIRAENTLLSPLRQGSAMVSRVEKNDRNLQRFQVILGDKPVRYEPNSQRTDSKVKYGWRPHVQDGVEVGGVDFMIEVSPERLETMAQGVPVVGIVDPQVTDIRQIFLFVGVKNLPHELPKSTTSQPQPPVYTRGAAASAQLDDSSLPASRGSAGLLGSSIRPSGRGGGYDNGPRVNELPNQFPEERTDWSHKNQADSRTREGDYVGRKGLSGSGTSSTRDPYRADESRRRYADDDRNRAYSDARYAGRNPEYDQRDSLNQLDSRMADRNQQQRALSTAAYNSAAGGQAAANPSLTPPGSQPNSAPVVQTNRQPGYPAAQLAVTSPNAVFPGAVTPTVVVPSEPAVQPWMPLILTTLSLFASLGANAYLGWLAWSFFWRYRDAASDVARARVANRQAA